jgi:CBS domain-containing protein
MAELVRDIMDPAPVTVSRNASVEEVVRPGHNRLPMVGDGRFMGVVTRSDVLGALVR